MYQVCTFFYLSHFNDSFSDLVMNGQRQTFVLAFPGLQDLKAQEDDYFSTRFRVWKRKYREQEGLFRNFPTTMKTKFGGDQVLKWSVLLHIPCDMVMCRIATISYPASRNLSSDSAFRLQIECVNILYYVQACSFVWNADTEDYDMDITWCHFHNVSNDSYSTWIRPYDNQCRRYINHLMNWNWKKYCDQGTRWNYLSDEGYHQHEQVVTLQHEDDEDDDGMEIDNHEDVALQQDSDGDVVM